MGDSTNPAEQDYQNRNIPQPIIEHVDQPDEGAIHIGPVTPPSQAPANSLLPPGVQRVSAEYRGPTPEGQARAAAQTAQIDQRSGSYAQQDAAQTQNEVQDYRQSIAGQQQALQGIGQANRNYEQELSTIDAQKQALFQEAAKQEKQIASEAKVAGAEFMNKYTQQLSAIRSMTVDINGPLSKLSTGEKGGLSLALFAQGFLAAQGININVQGQVDHWVDRSIHEQERQIGQAQQAANDTLNLWQISRQNSQDELEARQRYRGYIIEGLKSQIDLAAARFNSQLATANANVSIAKLDTEAAQTASAMRNQHEQRVFEQKKWETDTAYKTQMVNLETRKLDIEQQKANAATLKAQKDAKRQFIIDPSDGTVKWVVTENRINAADDAKKATEQASAYQRADKLVVEAMNFRREHIGDTWGHLSPLDRRVQAKREYEAQVERLAIEMGKTEFGTRASDKEADRIKKLIPFDKWYESGTNANIWSKYREDLRSEFQAIMDNHADAVPKDMQFKPEHNTANPGAQAEYTAASTGGPPAAKFAPVETAKVVAMDSREPPNEHAYASNLYQNFSREFTDAENAPDKLPNDVEGQNFFRAKAAGNNSLMAGWAVAIDHLANGWTKPEETKKFGDDNKIYYGTKNETPDEIKAESLKALKVLASGETEDGKRVPSLAKEYARWILKTGEENVAKLVDTLPNKTPDDTKYWPDQSKLGALDRLSNASGRLYDE